jgi:hypothetical protein
VPIGRGTDLYEPPSFGVFVASISVDEGSHGDDFVRHDFLPIEL